MKQPLEIGVCGEGEAGMWAGSRLHKASVKLLLGDFPEVAEERSCAGWVSLTWAVALRVAGTSENYCYFVLLPLACDTGKHRRGAPLHLLFMCFSLVYLQVVFKITYAHNHLASKFSICSSGFFINIWSVWFCLLSAISRETARKAV